MIIHNCIQGSFEWEELRAGKFTATDAYTLKTAGKGLDTLCYDKAAERITGNPIYTPLTKAMEWGKEQEPKARKCYEEITGELVKCVGFAEMDEFAGCSPDGLVGKDGLIEIKCKQENNHLFAIVNDWIDPKHECQMQFQMLVTGRNWCDYVLYNPLFKNPIYVKRVFKDAEKQAVLADG